RGGEGALRAGAARPRHARRRFLGRGVDGVGGPAAFGVAELATDVELVLLHGPLLLLPAGGRWAGVRRTLAQVGLRLQSGTFASEAGAANGPARCGSRRSPTPPPPPLRAIVTPPRPPPPPPSPSPGRRPPRAPPPPPPLLP